MQSSSNLVQSPPRPQKLSVWENKPLTGIYSDLARVIPTEDRLSSLLVNLAGIMVLLIVSNVDIIRNLLFVAFSEPARDLVRILGNGTAGFLLLFAIRDVYLLLYPPQKVLLTDKQRKLLGLPPGVEFTSGNQALTTRPAVPQTPSSPQQYSASPVAPSPSAYASSPSPYASPATPIYPNAYSSPVTPAYVSPVAGGLGYATSPAPFVPSPMRSPLVGLPPVRGSPATSSPLLRNSPALAEAVQRHRMQSSATPEDLSTLTDPAALEKYLDSAAKEKQQRAAAEADSMATTVLPAPMQRYRPAYRMPPRTAPSTNKLLGDHAYLYNQIAQETLERYGVVRSVDTWIERIRIWLAANVVKPLVAQMEDLERTHNLSLALPLLPTQSTTTYSTASSNSPWYSIAPPQYSAMLADLTKQAPQSEAWQTRVRVEAYMQVLGSTSREYLVQRIKALGEGDLLARFKWNGGGPWKDREWTAELPTDSQILIHLFCTYMDFVLPRDQQSVDPTKPFTSRYFCLVPDTPDAKANLADAAIYQLHLAPPHFEFVTSKVTEAVPQGRNNLFLALVMFIFLVKTKLEGYLGNVYLGSKSIRLLQVIDWQG